MACASKLNFSVFQNTINGQLQGTQNTRHGINPATETNNPEVPISTSRDVDAAVNASRNALISWQNTTYEERRKALEGLADALASLKAEFASLLTLEVGKPVSLI